MILSEVQRYIIDSEMDLDELIFERLGMTHEDLVAELIVYVKNNLKNFEDLERVKL